jgi:hypothetical protein
MHFGVSAVQGVSPNTYYTVVQLSRLQKLMGDGNYSNHWERPYPTYRVHCPVYYSPDIVTQVMGEEMKIMNSDDTVVDFTSLLTEISDKLDAIEDVKLEIENGNGILELMPTAETMAAVSDAISDMPEEIDLKPQLDETNRQLSLIDSRLYWTDIHGVKHPFLESLTTGAGFDGKLKNSAGDVIDLKELLDNVTTALASGAILSGDKMEPVRGFFALLKERWS